MWKLLMMSIVLTLTGLAPSGNNASALDESPEVYVQKGGKDKKKDPPGPPVIRDKKGKEPPSPPPQKPKKPF
jgi:hypothetical protein